MLLLSDPHVPPAERRGVDQRHAQPRPLYRYRRAVLWRHWALPVPHPHGLHHQVLSPETPKLPRLPASALSDTRFGIQNRDWIRIPEPMPPRRQALVTLVLGFCRYQGLTYGCTQTPTESDANPVGSSFDTFVQATGHKWMHMPMPVSRS